MSKFAIGTQVRHLEYDIFGEILEILDGLYFVEWSGSKIKSGWYNDYELEIWR